jgi:hypothetical protein
MCLIYIVTISTWPQKKERSKMNGNEKYGPFLLL